jgi:hypothetical protein
MENEPDDFGRGSAPAVPVVAAPAKPAANDGKAARSAQLRLVRKIAGTTLGLVQSAPARREMLAGLLGLRKTAATDTVVLVVALYEADASTAAPVLALLAIAETAEPIEAAVAAVELADDRDRAKAVWALLTSLGEVSGAIPQVAAKAGGAIAKAAQGLSKNSLAELKELRDLMR